MVLCVDTIGQVLTETADGLTTTKNNTENRPLCYCISAGATFVFGGITFSLGGNLIGQGSIAVSAFILSFSLSYGYYPARLAYDIAHGVY